MPRHTIELGPTGQRVVAFIVCLAATAGAAWFLIGANRRVTLAESAPSMVETSGRILSVEAHSGGRSGRRGPVRYLVDVNYEFEADGKDIRSDSVWITPPSFASRDDAEATARGLGLISGATLPVFYNSSDPARSLLFRDVDPAKAERDRSERLVCVCVAGLLAAGTVAAAVGVVRSMSK